MAEKDSSSPSSISNTTKLEGLIVMLTLLIKIGKYLPWIMLGFASLNIILAVLSFTLWHSMAGGIFNSILAFFSLLFFAQLIRRRKVHRHKNRYTRRDLHRETNIPEEEKVSTTEAG